MAHTQFAVVDTETTGLDPARDAVLSVALVLVDDGSARLESAQQWYVDPGFPIPPESMAIHALTDADVLGAPDLRAVLAEITPLISNRVLVGHNLGFDLAFLAAGGLRAELTLDTLEVSRLLWSGLGTRHTLDATAARLGVRPGDRHTALGDAVATAQILVACLPLLAARGLETPQAVAQAYRAQRLRRARLKRSIRRRSIRRPPRPHRHHQRALGR